MVEISGGRNLITKKCETSKRIDWGDILKLDPDVIIIAPCGFDIKRAEKELKIIYSKPRFAKLKSVRNSNVYLVDGNAYLTRPGPRIVEGIKILSEILHPKIFNRSHKESDWHKVVY
jgi:iron complex transport system substrate-binding protein